jgi:glc operon protein GlcG
MRRTLTPALAALGLALAAALPLSAQQPAPQPPAPRITLAEARQAVDAAEAEAIKHNWKLAFVITDAEGTPIYVRRMDGVPTRNHDIAMRKTLTAIKSGMHTLDYAAALQAGTIQPIENAVTFDGGLLLKRGGAVVGAFSASGARGNEDAQAVKAGMAVIGIQP